MKIQSNSIENGWEWYLKSFQHTKVHYKKFILPSLFYCLSVYILRAVPYAGHFISSLLCVFIHYASYKMLKSNENSPKFKTFYKYFKSSFRDKDIRKIFIFKFTTSLISFSLFSIIFVDSKFWPLSLIAGFFEIISLNIVFHAICLKCEFNIKTEDALFLSIKGIWKNILAECIFISWTVILLLSSSLPFMVGWLLTAPSFLFVNYHKFKFIYQREEQILALTHDTEVSKVA